MDRRLATAVLLVCLGAAGCGGSATRGAALPSTPARTAASSPKTSGTTVSTATSSSAPGAASIVTSGTADTSGPSSRASTSGPPATTLRPCRAAVSRCRGELAPGTYSSVETDLLGTGRPGQVTVTVPQGWANTLDHQPAYWLRPAEDYLADPADDGNDTSSGIYVWGDVAAAQQGGVCAEVSDTAVKTDARSLAAWMRTIDGVQAAPRPGERLGGRAATVLDLQLAADPPLCEGAPYVVLIASRPGAPDAYGWGLGAGDRARLWLVDLGGGHTTGVFVVGPAERFTSLLVRAAPILRSLRLATR